MIVWGLLWWFIAGFNEIARFVPNNYELKVAMLFIALTALAQAIASYKLNWSKISLSLVLLTPTLMLAVFVDDTIFASTSKNPMDYLGFIAWPIAIFVHLLVLRRNENTWPSWILSLWHSAGVWIVSFITIWAVAEWIDGISGINDTWLLSIIGLVIALIILGLIIWQLVALYEAGNPDPLMYIPILNPLDITQALAVIVMVYWLRFISKQNKGKWFSMPSSFIAGAAGIMSFVWVNAVISRSVHSFTNVSYSNYSMMNSSVFQTSTSIVWSVIAMALMAIAFKKASRLFWFSGAGLLALVVLKLFFVDLADSGSISRIISFLVVGGLMLVIGYLSPLPPKRKDNKEVTG